jgi:hypothetical protein
MQVAAERLGTYIYALCVQFMLNAARLTGTTYRDMNVAVLLVGFPAVTATLLVVYVLQRYQLKRLSLAASRSTAASAKSRPY